MAQLNTSIHLTDERGQTHVLMPYTDIPDWAEKRLRHDGTPGIWAGEGDEPEPVFGEAPSPDAPFTESTGTDDDEAKPRRGRKPANKSESTGVEETPQD